MNFSPGENKIKMVSKSILELLNDGSYHDLAEYIYDARIGLIRGLRDNDENRLRNVLHDLKVDIDEGIGIIDNDDTLKKVNIIITDLNIN